MRSKEEGAIGGMVRDPGKPKRFVEQRERDHLSQPTKINPKEAESGGRGFLSPSSRWVLG